MAGPYELDPGQTQYGILTHPVWQNTRVIVTNNSNKAGKISMTAGASATEHDDVHPGVTNFDRNFGGVLLAVKNEGDVHLTVSTQ
jgi:hypothetical protein